MKYVKAIKVFVCCGEYIAVDTNVTNKKFTCPRCGKELTKPEPNPTILIAKR